MTDDLATTARRAAVSMAALALVIALAGCADDEPADADSVPPSASATETTSEATAPTTTPPTTTQPTPTGHQEPALPARAKRPGKRGAKAFVAYYIRLLNYASWTGDTKTLRRLGPSCRGCNADVSLFERTYRKGGWFKGGAWTPISNSWTILPRIRGFYVGVNIDAAKGLQKRRRGGEVTRFRAERLHRDFHLVRRQHEWRVTYMEAEL